MPKYCQPVIKLLVQTGQLLVLEFILKVFVKPHTVMYKYILGLH